MLEHCSNPSTTHTVTHLGALAAHGISKGNAGAGRWTIEKIMSAYGHGEGKDGKRETVGKATNLWGRQKTLSRVFIHGNGKTY